MIYVASLCCYFQVFVVLQCSPLSWQALSLQRETITHLWSSCPWQCPATLEADVTLCREAQGFLLTPLSWETCPGSQS